MAIRPIRLLGDPVLRTVADPVTSFDAALRDLVTDLLDTLLQVPGRAGVAAPQIGVSVRAFAYWSGGRQGHAGHVVNPTIEVTGPVEEGDEAARPAGRRCARSGDSRRHAPGRDR